MSTITIDLVFIALADPTRRQVLDLLATEGPSSASDLSQHLPISRQAITKHLNSLHNAGLVTRQRQGKAILFVVQPDQLAATARWMQRTAERWGER